MKKSWIGILCVILLLLPACGREKEESENLYQIYYISNSETKVETHEYEMKAEKREEQLQELLDCLSAIPKKLSYKAPLDGMGFQLLSADLMEGRVMLNVDAGYLELPATTEVLVRAAIVRTLTQLEGIDYVGILVDGNQLFDNAGEPVSWMKADQFIYNDGNEINTYELTRVKLYFANADGDKLIATYREKYYSTNMPLERFVVDELIAGPNGQLEGLYQAINPETKIINVMTRDGTCYVNLDNNFLTVADNVSIEVAVYSIVNSLVELNNVNKVQILVNGVAPSVLPNSVFERNLDYVTALSQ